MAHAAPRYVSIPRTISMQHRYLLASAQRDLAECSTARPIDVTTNADFFQLALDERKIFDTKT